MFLSVDCIIYNHKCDRTINTDQITCYFSQGKDKTIVNLSDGTGLEVLKPIEWFDDILVFKNTDPTPVKEIDDNFEQISTEDDNPLGFESDNEPIEELENNNERMATEKQISYIKSIARKKHIVLPRKITFSFAKKFLDEHVGKIKPRKSYNSPDFDPLKDEPIEDDEQYPGFKD